MHYNLKINLQNMKTTFTLLIALFLSLVSFAIPLQSKLGITVVGNKNIEIMVGNSKYQSEDNSTVISNLQPGHHTIKIYSLKKNQRRNVWGNNRNNTQLIYQSTVYIRAGYFVDIIINRFGKALVDERAFQENGRNDYWEDDPSSDNHNRSDDRNDYNRKPVNESSFVSIVQTLRREYSETSRLVLAKQIIGRNYFATEQVKQMIQLFAFESNKLEIAKYAYGNTSDQRNYFVVYDVLSYSSSKEELAEYIRTYR